MFKKIWHWIKEHPYLTMAIVVGGIILAALLAGVFSGGSSGTSANSGPDDTIQAAEINASAQLQAAQIGANVSNTQTAEQQTLGLAYLNEQQTTTLAADQLELDLTNANNQASIEALQLSTGAAALNDLNNLDALAAKGPIGSFSQDRQSLLGIASQIFSGVGKVASTPSTVNSVLTGGNSSSLTNSPGSTSSTNVSAQVAAQIAGIRSGIGQSFI